MTEKLDSWAATRTLIKLRNQAPPLIPAEQSDSFALSLSQERLLALEQLNTQPLYNLPYAFHLQGRLNLSALNQSLVMMLHRQQVLRTTFETTNGQPKQVIQPSQPIELAPIDLSHLSPEQAKTEIITALRQPFNLPQEPPFRCRLYYLGPDEYVLGFTFHHIIYDYWSQSIFFRELNSCYTAYLNNIEPALKSLPIQYADFAIWQRQWLSQPGVLEFLLDYWQPQLQGLNQPDLPADNVSADGTERVMKQLKITFSAEQVTALKVLARQTKVQLFTILLTALKLVVANHLKTSDVAIFSPVTNRHRPEFQHLMGDFSNLLILRTDLAGEFTITELLQRVGQTVSGAIAYQDLPLQLIKASIPLKLPQISFSYLNTPQQTLVLPHLVIESWDLASGTDDFDIFLFLMESQGELSGYLKYNTCLLSQTMIQEMINQFQTSLMDMIRQPEQSISNQVFKPPQEQATNELLLSIPDLIDQIQYPLKKSRPASVLQQQLSLAPAEERYELLETHIKSEIKLIMGTVPSDERSFFDLGMDSLMSIQLSNRLSAALQVSLPTTITLEYSSVAKLTDYVAEIVLDWKQIPVHKMTHSNRENELDKPITWDIYDWFPQTYIQRLFYNWYEMAENKSFMNVVFSTHVHSEIDSASLQTALQLLINRHISLRLVYDCQNNMPMQKVQKHQNAVFEHIQIDCHSWKDIETEIVATAKRPFNLQQGPVIRVHLFTRDTNDHILVIVMHHIIADATSMCIIVNELFTLYQANQTGDFVVSKTDISYLQFMQWHTTMLKQTEGEKLWQYWRQQLSGELELINMPTDYPRRKKNRHYGAAYNFELPIHLSKSLQQLAKSQATTLYTLMLTAYKLLLHFYTKQREILVDTNMSNRLDERFKQTVGQLSTMLTIRTHIPEDITFQELLKQVQLTVWQAQKHQGYPSELLIEQLKPSVGFVHNRLGQVWFNLMPLHFFQSIGPLVDPTNKEAIVRGNLILTPTTITPSWLGSWFEIETQLSETKDKIFGYTIYDTDLYKDDTIKRFIERYKNILEEIVIDPNQSISTILCHLVKENCVDI